MRPLAAATLLIAMAQMPGALAASQEYCWDVTGKDAWLHDPGKIQAFESWCPGHQKDYDADTSYITCHKGKPMWQLTTALKNKVRRPNRRQKVKLRIGNRTIHTRARFNFSEMHEQYYAEIDFPADHEIWKLLKNGTKARIIYRHVSTNIGTRKIEEAINKISAHCRN